MEKEELEKYKRSMRKLYWASVDSQIQRYLQNLWHEPKEEPEANRWILVEYMDDKLCYDTMQRTYDNWTEVYNYDGNITRWFYIDDLLPKKGGEQC